MRKLKLLLAIIIASFLLPFLASPAWGTSENVKVKLNGETVSSDVPAYVDSNARTMVPVRFISESLGSQVEWDEDKQQVSILSQGQVIQLWISDNRAMVNGNEVILDTVPVLAHDRTMVPLRFIAETLGLAVDWVESSVTVELYRQEAPASGSRTAVVIEKIVNIRSGPGTTNELIGQVTAGSRLPVILQQGEWLMVRQADGKIGWVAGWLVRIEGETADSGGQPPPAGDAGGDSPAIHIARVAVVTSGVVNIRTGPGADRDLLTRVTQGQRLDVLGQEGDWYRVKVLDKEGWIAGWLVDVKEILPPLDTEISKAALLEIKKTAIMMGETVNIRTSPGITAPLAAQMPLGAVLDIIDEQGQWYKVRVSGGTGWVAKWLVATQMTAGWPVEGDTSDKAVEIGNWGSGTQPGDSASDGGPALITGLRVEQIAGAIALRVFATGTLTQPQALRLDNPSRLVFELPGVLKAGVSGAVPYIQVDKPPVIQVQASQFTPNTVRVVAELDRPAAYAARAEDDGKLMTVSIRPASLAGRTIVIDPGHGKLQPGDWTDPGAIGRTGLKERDIVLDMAWRVSEMLLAEGATVMMTRTGDTNLTLPERSLVANEHGADVLVSIHANASPSRTLAGVSTYYKNPRGTDQENQIEARKRLARDIQAELLRKTQRNDLGTMQADFSVLRNATVPAVLVETAFISNPEEERLLADAGFRSLVAEGIVNGLRQYFKGFSAAI